MDAVRNPPHGAHRGRVALGESVEIRRRNEAIAVIQPLTRLNQGKRPNFKKRLQAIYGDQVFEQTATGLLNEVEKQPNRNILKNMTTLEEQAQKLPRLQKISLMEKLWADLSAESEGFEPPAWHAGELEATERRIQEGKEHFEDWNEAKRKLRES